MNMKYFRFLYCVTGACFLHFGEIRDTKLEEAVSFLYLRRKLQQDGGQEGQQNLFLCPEYVDYAVLGLVDEAVEQELYALMKHTHIGTLVLPAKEADRFAGKTKGADRVVYVGGEESPCGRQEKDETGYTAWTADHLEWNAAGWKVSVRSQGERSLAMLHMYDANVPFQYEDCIMNVKAMDAGKHCCREGRSDEFGCALGCVLHQDYDVCRYRNPETSMEYLTGALLLGESRRMGFVVKDEEKDRIRFFAADNLGTDWGGLLWKEEKGPKRYYIGSAMSDGAAAAVCRSGGSRIPVLLQEGCGICCAGLMKYAEPK